MGFSYGDITILMDSFGEVGGAYGVILLFFIWGESAELLEHTRKVVSS